MSLRKSPQLTPALLAAARNNAQHSTGPRSPAAKQNVKLNGLKHGGYVADENRRHAMLALGEDPEKLQTLTEELMSAYGPGDALWQKQVEDLAWLYSRRDRLERVQEDGLRRRALQAIDGWQHHRQQETARVSFDSSQHVMIDVNLPDSNDRGVTLRKTISYLEMNELCGNVIENKGSQYLAGGEGQDSDAKFEVSGSRREALWSAAACRRFCVSSLLEALLEQASTVQSPVPEATFRPGKATFRQLTGCTPKTTFCRCSCASAVRRAKKNSSKLNERSGKVYENNGPLCKGWGLSWYVYENTCT